MRLKLCKMTKINGHFLAHLYIYGRGVTIKDGILEMGDIRLNNQKSKDPISYAYKVLELVGLF